jgi:hypothetical protein
MAWNDGKGCAFIVLVLLVSFMDLVKNLVYLHLLVVLAGIDLMSD